MQHATQYRIDKEINKHKRISEKCNCCPYGYHIDVDFVRYCEALADSTLTDAQIQRKNRRRQRKSLEFMLGIDWDISFRQFEQQFEVPNEIDEFKYTNNNVTNIEYNRINGELNSGTIDIIDNGEDVYKKFDEETSKLYASDDKKNNNELNVIRNNDIHLYQTNISKIENSKVENFTISKEIVMVPKIENCLNEKIITKKIEMVSTGTSPDPKLSVENNNNNVTNLNSNALNTIRQKMALSLKRTQELEEKLKTIPQLEMNILNLKAENIKLENQIKILKNDYEKINKLNNISQCEIGIMCHPQTRDIGFSSTDINVNNMKNSSTETENLNILTNSELEILFKNKIEKLKLNKIKNLYNNCTQTENQSNGKVSIGILVKPKSKDFSSNFNHKPIMMNSYTMTNKLESSINSGKTKCTIGVSTNDDQLLDQPLLSLKNLSNPIKFIEKLSKSIQCDDSNNLNLNNFNESMTVDGVNNKINDRNTKSVGCLTEQTVLKNKSCQHSIKMNNNSTNTYDLIELSDKQTNTKIKQYISTSSNTELKQTTSKYSNTEQTNMKSVSCGNDDKIKFKSNSTCTKDLIQLSSKETNTNFTNCINCDKNTVAENNDPLDQNQTDVVNRRKILERQNTYTVGEIISIDDNTNEMTNTKEENSFRLNNLENESNSLKLITSENNENNDCVNKISLSSLTKATKTNISPEKNLSSSASIIATSSNRDNDIDDANDKSAKINAPNKYENMKIVTKTTTTVIRNANHYHPENIVKQRNDSTNTSISNKVNNMPNDNLKEIDIVQDDMEKPDMENYDNGKLTQNESDIQQQQHQQQHKESNPVPNSEKPEKVRTKAIPSQTMLAAMKVINDSLQKLPNNYSVNDINAIASSHLKKANAIVQKEWFHIACSDKADPHAVEDYLDCFEEYSNRLLKYVVNLKDAHGNTCMHYAVAHENFDIVSILLDSQMCNVNQTNDSGYTCVMLVSLANLKLPAYRTVVQKLLQLCDVNVRAKTNNQTALMLAVAHGNIDIVHMLLEAGADINIQDEDGSTALMCAAEHGRIDIVKLLLAQPDCDSSIQDKDGNTALKISLDAGHRDIGILLYAHEHMSQNKLSPYSSLKLKRTPSNLTAKSTSANTSVPSSPRHFKS